MNRLDPFFKLECKTCKYHLVGEMQKGKIYYRCHNCPRVSVREDRIPALMTEKDAAFTITTAFKSELEPYDKFESP